MEQFKSYPSELKKFFVFKNCILKSVRPSPNNIFNCDIYKGIRLIKQLRVGISHLRKYKFKRNFQDCLNPICSCGLYIEFAERFEEPLI